MLQKIKTLLGVTDTLQDDVINLIIENVNSHLSVLLKKPVPSELEFIVIEIAVRRFQRLGSEGYKSELVEGHRVDFYDLNKEFDPYLDIIEMHQETTPIPAPSRGKVLFF